MEVSYTEQAERALDLIEADPGRRKLWNAICDAIDLVCDQPDSAEARREALRTPGGNTIWRVPIRYFDDDQDWVLLWYPDHQVNETVILYVGHADFK